MRWVGYPAQSLTTALGLFFVRYVRIKIREIHPMLRHDEKYRTGDRTEKRTRQRQGERIPWLTKCRYDMITNMKKKEILILTGL